MKFTEWLDIQESKKHKHKKKKHHYYCPGCGFPVYVDPEHGHVCGEGSDLPHHCPSTDHGSPSGPSAGAASVAMGSGISGGTGAIGGGGMGGGAGGGGGK